MALVWPLERPRKWSTRTRPSARASGASLSMGSFRFFAISNADAASFCRFASRCSILRDALSQTYSSLSFWRASRACVFSRSSAALRSAKTRRSHSQKRSSASRAFSASAFFRATASTCQCRIWRFWFASFTCRRPPCFSEKPPSRFCVAAAPHLAGSTGSPSRGALFFGRARCSSHSRRKLCSSAFLRSVSWNRSLSTSTLTSSILFANSRLAARSSCFLRCVSFRCASTVTGSTPYCRIVLNRCTRAASRARRAKTRCSSSSSRS
mmetsp:Transcript_26421/g.81296  ORF Transcript_26421/g.81296 Transcript_26421/m.81296 type:complete len:267 (-) Transcript_26421:44-844(-)